MLPMIYFTLLLLKHFQWLADQELITWCPVSVGSCGTQYLAQILVVVSSAHWQLNDPVGYLRLRRNGAEFKEFHDFICGLLFLTRQWWNHRCPGKTKTKTTSNYMRALTDEVNNLGEHCIFFSFPTQPCNLMKWIMPRPPWLIMPLSIVLLLRHYLLWFR